MSRYIYIPGITDGTGIANVAKTGSFNDLVVSTLPTTLAGYKITDAVKTDGTDATGTGWAISITGNAATATTASAVAWSNITDRYTDLNQFNNADGFTTLSSVQSNANSFTAVQKFVGIKEVRVDLGGGTTPSISLDTGSYFIKTVTASTTTFSISGTVTAGEGRSFILEITNGGSYTTSFAGTGFLPKWAGGTAPTLSTTGRDILGFYCIDGSTWNGFMLAKAVA